jgi:hypothetical protein
VPGSDMFRSRQEVVADAYARQGTDIAYSAPGSKEEAERLIPRGEE